VGAPHSRLVAVATAGTRLQSEYRTRVRRCRGAQEVPAALDPERRARSAHDGPSSTARANDTWLVNYQPIIEQCLADLVAWVEEGVEPTETAFEYRDGAIRLPDSAAERGGIQPVVSVTANGRLRVDALVGEPVTLTVSAETPPGAETIIAVQWDFDGSGSYPQSEKVEGTEAAVTLTTTHRYAKPSTYFATALVESHRTGDLDATSCRIPSLASARIVVT
jgi:hypothetical protein